MGGYTLQKSSKKTDIYFSHLVTFDIVLRKAKSKGGGRPTWHNTRLPGLCNVYLVCVKKILMLFEKAKTSYSN